ncbi:MAG: hypothetical protein ACE5HP_03400 [Gemmatimonadota bacterium]
MHRVTSRCRAHRPRSGGIAGALLGVLLVACSDDSGTEPAPTPDQLRAISPAVDTLLAGEAADPPLSVQVVSSLGNPVEGIPVRFLIVSGPGRVDPVAVSDDQGIAEAAFRAGSELGEARVRVDIPSAGNVASLQFRLTVLPASSVRLQKEAGDGQQAEVGSQLPLPFVVRAVTLEGAPAGGVAIAWSLTSPQGGGSRLTADTTYTDPEGLTRVLLTLGDQATQHQVVAHASGDVASDTLRFTATATAAATGAVRLDSIRPRVMRAGAEAVAFGSGFSSSATGMEVRVEGEASEILETAASIVRFRVPEFADRCLPAREVGVRVLVDGQPSNGALSALEPREPPIVLDPGEAITLAGAGQLTCLQFAAPSEGIEFWLGVQSGSRAGAATTPLRLLVRAGTGGPRVRLSAERRAGALATLPRSGRERPTAEPLLRRGVRQELRRGRVAPVRHPSPDSSRRAAVRGAPTTPGDTLHFFFAVQPNLAATCADTTNRVAGVVKAVGAGVILAVDGQTPPGGFTDAEWASLADEFDRVVLPTDRAYFGTPSDIDGNGRVVLLFTPEVNRLTPPGSASFIGGFFLALDLADSGRGGGAPSPDGGTCPASNEAEIIYAAVPDPAAAFGDALTVSQTRRIVRELMPHELQHLINAGGRVLDDETGFEAREESWLDEGLSHLAEEVTGLALAGAPVRQNLTFDLLAGGREELELFNAFHIVNFFNLSLFLFDPTGTPALAAVDPGGLGGSQMRGRTWLFLRWLGDQEGGPDERELFRALAAGGPTHRKGVDNVEEVTGVRWEELLADFVATLPLDDGDAPPVSDRHRVTTWNLRDVFAALNTNPSSRGRFPLPFPLAFTPLPFENAAADFELGGSAARYFRIQGGFESPALALSLLSPGGGVAPAGAEPQITIVRTR